jgi:hypothetical protein
MIKKSSRRLCALLTEAVPLRRLPSTVIRQLVGYYGDWRRSRDILNEVVEAGHSSRFFTAGPTAGRMNSYRAQ